MTYIYYNLTLHGHDPSEDSAGNLDYTLISYKDDLQPWLERCQQRAYDEPELRESVAQYRQLVRKLTGTDYTGVYMEALKKLCLEDNNLVLVLDLHEAARIALLKRLWDKIEEALKHEIPDLPAEYNKSDISEAGIKRFVQENKRHGLYYGNNETRLGVEVDARIYFGVICSKDKYDKLKEKLNKEIPGGKSDEGLWPWYQYAVGDLNLRDPARKNIKSLSNKETRQKFAKRIAQDLKRVWEVLKKYELQD